MQKLTSCSLQSSTFLKWAFVVSVRFLCDGQPDGDLAFELGHKLFRYLSVFVQVFNQTLVQTLRRSASSDQLPAGGSIEREVTWIEKTKVCDFYL